MEGPFAQITPSSMCILSSVGTGVPGSREKWS
jgi:hypothetical protein